jgi:hypothetical protein
MEILNWLWENLLWMALILLVVLILTFLIFFAIPKLLSGSKHDRQIRQNNSRVPRHAETWEVDAHDQVSQGGGRRMGRSEPDLQAIRSQQEKLCAQQENITRRLIDLQTQITKGFGEVRVAISSTRPPADYQPYATPQVDPSIRTPTLTVEKYAYASQRSRADMIAESYNQEANSFLDRYPAKEFTIANMHAMGKDQSLAPEYCFVEQTGQGEYWFVDSGDGSGYSVPRYKAVYNFGQFKSGGLDRVFDCGAVGKGYRYRKVRVIKPARFRQDGSGHLVLEHKGSLEFGDEENET